MDFAPFNSIADVVREVPLHTIVSQVQSVHRAHSLGPLLFPESWNLTHIELEAAKLDVFRRIEDLRRALIDADELQRLIDKKVLDKQQEAPRS